MQETNFLAQLSEKNQKLVKRRILGVIMATDMEQHMVGIKTVNEHISNGKRFDDCFENQQLALDLCVHSSDLSFLARDFKVGQVWVDLLFDEFFHQGDLQSEQGLPLSMLCDRNPDVTNIPKGQIGFISFGPLQLFKTLTLIVPKTEFIVKALLENQTQWANIQVDEFISTHKSKKEGKIEIDDKLWKF